MEENIKLQGLEASHGEKIQGYVQIAGTSQEIPVTLINGLSGGKTVLITGGIHNAEYVGIQAAMELAADLNPAKISGKIIILPLVNRSGFESRTMSVVFEDGKNLNREFPGKEDGTLGEQICFFLEKQLFSQADYYIDLHCGDGFEELKPYVYSQGMGSDEVLDTSKKMAQAVNVPYIVRSGAGSGGAYNYAGTIGLPGILIERGCSGVWTKEEVQEMKNDVFRVLQKLEILKTNAQVCEEQTQIITETFYENASYTGCWYPNYRAGDNVEKESVLGVIKDYFGNVLDTCVAKEKAVVLYQTASLCIQKDSPMIAYGRLE